MPTNFEVIREITATPEGMGKLLEEWVSELAGRPCVSCPMSQEYGCCVSPNHDADCKAATIKWLNEPACEELMKLQLTAKEATHE